MLTDKFKNACSFDEGCSGAAALEEEKLSLFSMENSPALKALIRKNAHLFWYIRDEAKENLPLSVVTEFFLNYADKEDVKQLFAVAGIDNVADVFFRQTEAWGERSNYFPEIQNFFTLYFKRYAPKYSG